MHNTLQTLLAGHNNLRRLVALLERQPVMLADPDDSHAGLLVDALTYLTQYPDTGHHLMEDHMAQRLLACNALDHAQCAEIEAQHATLARQGRALLDGLEGALRKDTASGEWVSMNTRLYAERLRHNMAVEELVLFPAAQRTFTDADWQAIEAANLREAPDPLFHTHVQAQFKELHHAIAMDAGCDCEP